MKRIDTYTSKGIKNISFKIGMVIITIFVFVYLFFQIFSQKVTPKLIHIAELSMTKYIHHITSNFKLFTLEKNASDKFLKITENKDGEIVGIDYEMTSIYKLADELTNSLEENIEDATTLNHYVSKEKLNSSEGIVLLLPIGIVSDSIFLSNLGPKIPVLVRFMDSVFSSVKTRVKDYGINNVLLEIYLDVTINYEILTPITLETKKINYELLLDSKVIQGKVPNIYGGVLESRSTFFSIPF